VDESPPVGRAEDTEKQSFDTPLAEVDLFKVPGSGPLVGGKLTTTPPAAVGTRPTSVSAPLVGDLVEAGRLITPKTRKAIF
jgi:hypothetical protein